MPGAEQGGRPGALKATTEELVWRKGEREKVEKKEEKGER